MNIRCSFELINALKPRWVVVWARNTHLFYKIRHKVNEEILERNNSSYLEQNARFGISATIERLNMYNTVFDDLDNNNFIK